jgi:adenine deaminase
MACSSILYLNYLIREKKMWSNLNPEVMHKLRKVALGQEKADLVVVQGELVNVYSGEILQDQSIAVKDEWIVYVGGDIDHTVGPETEIIDASGKVLIPGLIDSHTHMIWYCTPDEFVRYATRGGTTTFITEISELSHLGYHALLEYLQALENQPAKIFATAPPAITLSHSFRQHSPDLEQFKELLLNKNVLGVGEGYWQEVLRGEKNFPALAAESLRIGKVVEGHAAGCKDKRLQAYLTTGVSSCHESVSAAEVLEKVRLGVFTMIREGSIRKELEAIYEIKDRDVNFSRLALVTDGIEPRELVQRGHLECAVRRAIELGFDPVLAIQMATLNPAIHFHLDGMLGGLAPAKYADIVVISDLRTFRAEWVISNGRVIAKDGQFREKKRQNPLSFDGPKDIRVDPREFAIHVKGNGPYRVRAMDQVSMMVTREAILEIMPSGRELKADPERDLLKASLITCERKVFTGFIRGLGLKKGALAASNGWEISGIITVGSNEDEMADAVNRVAELRGGIVLYAEGNIRAELPLPIGGILSNLSAKEIVQRLEHLQIEAKNLGFPFEDVMLTICTLTTPAIPFLRLSEHGLVDLRKGEVVDLIIS